MLLGEGGRRQEERDKGRYSYDRPRKLPSPRSEGGGEEEEKLKEEDN